MANYQYSDGGREAAGFKGTAGDCFVRAVAIASGRGYKAVYDLVNEYAARERRGKRKRGISSARDGVYRGTAQKVCAALGGRWVSTMGIGTGCRVHVRADELPAGRLVLNLSKHFAAFIDGTVLDNHDPRRDGTRCVYGYWVFEDPHARGNIQPPSLLEAAKALSQAIDAYSGQVPATRLADLHSDLEDAIRREEEKA